jgi:maltooligosyltrehalose trehalohydrolase
LTSGQGRKNWALDVGANPVSEGGVEFRVWAPFVKRVALELTSPKGERSSMQMEADDRGFHVLNTEARAGSRYMYVLDGDKRRPDPVSRFLPQGVHGPSEVVDASDFPWTDAAWRGVPHEQLLVYEIHVGTYTPEGTFAGVSRKLDYLKHEVGVTAVELMPVGQFPGERNWGYDGVSPYAPQNSYGGPAGLKKLVDQCHAKGLAVLLDVVYNHLGPEGNYLGEFAPYFSNKYKTPWGPALNYDDRGCDEVRRFVVNNALYWITEYHFDGLRLDAVNGIFDFSPRNILLELTDAVHARKESLGRELHVIAESDLNDPKLVSPRDLGGYGLDAQWSDDFHHSVHAFLTGERFRYYEDFGKMRDIEKALRDGFVYDGRYSEFRGRTHGAPSSGLPGKRFLISVQNHDQIGNRPDGARLSTLLTRPALKVAVGLLLLAPNVPLLFMGEEFGETAPFHYFVSHSDPALVRAVREGRRNEMYFKQGGRFFSDPQDRATFESSKLNHGLRRRASNRELLRYYRALIEMRRSHPALGRMNRDHMEIRTLEEEGCMLVRRWEPGVEELLLVYVLGAAVAQLDTNLLKGAWKQIFESEARPDRHDRGVPSRGPFLEFPPYSLTIFRSGA